jgi:uncharacterized ParB-like nuclease family protein
VVKPKVELLGKGAVTETELPLAVIDMSLTNLVRDHRNEETIEEYARTEEEWSEKAPIDVYAGGNKYYGADGGHRFAAKIKNGRKNIRCRVVPCASAQSAYELARLHAFAANAGHGLQRSAADKRKAVTSCLALPKYAEASDREIAEICKVGRSLVGEVRRAMTANQQLEGPAAATSRRYPKRDESGRAATLGRELIADRADAPVPEPHAAASVRAATPADAPVPAPAPVPFTVPKPPADGGQVLDGRGRQVPDPLVPLFRLGRAFVADLRSTLLEVVEGVRQSAEEPWGRALSALLPGAEADAKKIGQDVGGAVPFCCCPHIDDRAEHPLGGKCKVCTDNRGWLSRLNWHQQPDGVKKLIDELAVEKPVTDVA